MKKNNLPIFGIGPVYVISCLILTLAGLALNHYGLIKLEFPVPKIVVSIIGVIFILFGILLWFYAVIVQKIDEAIKEGKLKKGDKFVATGFGGGLTYGSILIEISK